LSNIELSEFKLVPYEPNEKFSVLGIVQCSPKAIHVGYLIEGPLKELIIPEVSEVPGKKDKLWEHTCFELFISEKSSEKYFEFNFSPSKDWAAFYFDDYRDRGAHRITKTMREPTMGIETTKNEFKVEILFENPLGLPKKDLEFGVSTVLETKKGEKLYWALIHPGAAPDFHLRDSFIL
jgi:hypothetical protein